MIFRQLFDHESYTYTYLLADENTRRAVLIDPVQEQLEGYLRLLEELDLKLAVALDTHVHADHITALGDLREKTGCITYLGSRGEVACADNGLAESDRVTVDGIELQVIFTPGHTDDSYCFYTESGGIKRVFTGDTLLIRGSGRTDFQNGSADDLYQSLHQRVLKLPDDTWVYPAHDYKGWTVSTIGEEKRHNPRVLIESKEAFIEHMNNLNLPNPKWMDVAVPANKACGKSKQ